MPNISAAIKELKDNGLWVYGTAADGQNGLWSTDLTGAIALVIGSEGEGMSRLVKESCDFILSLPMKGGQLPQRLRGCRRDDVWCSASAARRADIFLTLPQLSTARPTYRNKDQDMKDFSLDFDPQLNLIPTCRLTAYCRNTSWSRTRTLRPGRVTPAIPRCTTTRTTMCVSTHPAQPHLAKTQSLSTDSGDDDYADDGYDAQDYGYDSAVSSRADDYGEGGQQ